MEDLSSRTTKWLWSDKRHVFPRAGAASRHLPTDETAPCVGRAHVCRHRTPGVPLLTLERSQDPALKWDPAPGSHQDGIWY